MVSAVLTLTRPAPTASASWNVQRPPPWQLGTVKLPVSFTCVLPLMSPSSSAAVAVLSLKVDPGV